MASSSILVRVVRTSCAVLALAATVGNADAQQSAAADRETARTLMAEGRAAFKNNDLKAALQAFQAADALVHAPTTALEVARTQVAGGMLVEARDTLATLLRTARKPTDPAVFNEARSSAEQLYEQLGTRIPSLRIVLKNLPEGASPTVRVDGVEVPATALTAPRRVNPGAHLIQCTLGDAEREQKVDVVESDSKEVAIDLGGSQPAGVSSTSKKPAPAVAPGPTTSPISSGPEPGRSHTLAYSGIALGTAGLLTGVIGGALTLSYKQKAIDNGCDNNLCPPAAHGDADAARTAGTVSTIGFVVAGAGAALVLIDLWSSPAKSSPAPDSRSSVRIWLGSSHVSLAGRF
jgi:hypothetical protein